MMAGGQMLFFIFIAIPFALALHAPVFPVLFAAALIQALIAFARTRTPQVLALGSLVLLTNAAYAVLSTDPVTPMPANIASTLKLVLLVADGLVLFSTTAIGIFSTRATEAT
jgi:hypothetical protein